MTTSVNKNKSVVLRQQRQQQQMSYLCRSKAWRVEVAHRGNVVVSTRGKVHHLAQLQPNIQSCLINVSNKCLTNPNGARHSARVNRTKAIYAMHRPTCDALNLSP